MKNFLVVKDGFETVLPADWMSFNNDTGQTMLFDKKQDCVIAVLPKEAIVIETTDLTDYQKTLQEIISNLQIITHNDRERELQDYRTLDFWKDQHRLNWLKRFEELYEQTL